MARVTVLGGCGAVGSVAVKTLAQSGVFSEVVIGDANIERARQMAKELGGGVTAAACNATDPPSVQQAVQGSDVVLNGVGPFYTTVKPILAAVLECGINYVDVCDDVDVTIDLLNMDDAVRKADTAPGMTNIVAKFAATARLDPTDLLDILHTHSAEPSEGGGMIKHRFHCRSIPVHVHLDGELR
jgi:saccharopine dehydrogenase (NAD+, L-lysine-forming)